MYEDYQTLLANFLSHNPQYTPGKGESLHLDVYIWDKIIGEKGPNGCFFGG